jgi:hypothetical protein
MAVTGTTRPELALRVLERAGLAHEPVTGAGGVRAVRLARVWAEAYLPYANYRGAPVDAQGKVWVPLDAAFKPLPPPTGFSVLAELELDERTLMEEYLAAPRTQPPLAFLKERVSEALAPSGRTYEDALNRRAHAPEALGILPNTLPYAVVAREGVFYSVPDALRHEVRVVARALGAAATEAPLLEAALPLADALGGRLTLGYVPFDEDDDAVVRAFGGLARTPPYLVELRAVLRRGGLTVAAGTRPVGAGVASTWRSRSSTRGGRTRSRTACSRATSPPSAWAAAR